MLRLRTVTPGRRKGADTEPANKGHSYGLEPAGCSMDSDQRQAASRFFYRSSDVYHQHIVAKDERWFKPYVGFICKYVSSGATILDLGCGNGVSTEILARIGYRAVGCDLWIPSSTNRPGMTALCEGDGMFLPFRDGTFDAVAGNDFLEHVADPSAMLAEMVRVCRVDGRIIVHGPNHLSPVHPVKLLLAGLFHPGGVRPSAFGGDGLTILLMGVRSAWWLIGKMISGRCRFIPRRPEYNRHDLGGDFDALWWSNPVDVKHWFRDHGHMIIAYQTEGKARRLRDMAPGVQVVAARVR